MKKMLAVFCLLSVSLPVFADDAKPAKAIACYCASTESINGVNIAYDLQVVALNVQTQLPEKTIVSFFEHNGVSDTLHLDTPSERQKAAAYKDLERQCHAAILALGEYCPSNGQQK